MLAWLLCFFYVVIFSFTGYLILKHLIRVCPVNASDAQDRRDFAQKRYDYVLRHPTCRSYYFANRLGCLRHSLEFVPFHCMQCQTLLKSCSIYEFMDKQIDISKLRVYCEICQSSTLNFFATSDNLLKNLAQTRGVIVFIHGFGMNNLLSMTSFITKVLEAGYSFFAIDLEGHGLSDGLSGYLSKDANLLIQDILDYIMYVQRTIDVATSKYELRTQAEPKEHEEGMELDEPQERTKRAAPIHLMGFSIGATCALIVAEQLQMQQLQFQHTGHNSYDKKPILRSVIIASPFQYHFKTFLPSVLGIFTLFVCRVITNLVTCIAFPTAFMKFLDQYDQHFMDSIAYQVYLDCKIAYHSFPSLTSCLAIHQLCNRLTNLTASSAIKVSNLLVLQGQLDTIVPWRQTKLIYDRIRNVAKENKKTNNRLWKLYPHLKHTLLFGNEPTIQARLYDDILEFLIKQ